MKPLFIYGAGGHAKIAVETALSKGIRPELLIDDQPKSNSILGISVITPSQMTLADGSEFGFLVGIGDNGARKRVFLYLISRAGHPEFLVHARAYCSSFSGIGAGSLVCAGSVIQPNAQIGENVIINTGASVDHDCVVGDHSHIAPGARLAGAVVVGELAFIGMGAMVLPGVRIGARTVIGAGAVVIKDIPDGMVAYGSPARVRRKIIENPSQ